MRVMALDLATRTGMATALSAAERPRVASWKLKDPEDDPSRAFRKLGIRLRDEFAIERPDVVVIEAPLMPGGAKGHTNAKTHYLLIGLVAVAHGICGPYGIRCVEVSVQKVRKFFVGDARPQDPKRVVMARCHMLGLLPKTERDDNVSDAVALWSWGAATYGNPTINRFTLFGGTIA
jgi:hypothetical protein